MLDDSFRGAAEENAPPSRPAVGGHNNQVGVDLAGQLTDLFESVPGRNMTTGGRIRQIMANSNLFEIAVKPVLYRPC